MQADYQAWQEFTRAQATVAKVLDENLQRECGLPLRWFEALAALVKSDGQALVQQDLSTALCMSQSATSRLVTRLEQSGLVRRCKIGDDGRAVTVELTAAGDSAYRRAEPRYLSHITEQFGTHMSDINIARFRTAMRRLGQPSSGGSDAPQSPVHLLGFGESILAISADPVGVADALHVRDALEPLVLLEAAQYRTVEDIADCRALIANMERCIDNPEQYYRTDWRLHGRLAAICRNAVLRTTYLGLLAALESHLDTVVRTDNDADYIRRRMSIHREIVEAVASSNTQRVLRATDAHRFMGIRTESVAGRDNTAQHI
ncbi:FCD domain-containing protein [Micromonospora echinofusca]|uniref:FCD domain-containing protein n=1 Tax=Micromonospora echinofusca TaxID=47858 RepID=A0ABS3W0H6_MICEH|nr:FCD domain-containing protein [Micromonospora echinofusca]MBO4210301.1 FCD domain-containing protein [Micromonospora echinofusca]